MWHVSSRSGVATLRTAVHLLFTYLLTACPLSLHGYSTAVVSPAVTVPRQVHESSFCASEEVDETSGNRRNRKKLPGRFTLLLAGRIDKQTRPLCFAVCDIVNFNRESPMKSQYRRRVARWPSG